ncbi:MAG: 4'-phosphopantetheinyl transferase superfamily protein [Gammaproteobacteria bacterium]|nr:4'-phosphopantetheinyl transferase superfamily protein [Gammaproteobacteria bacterium]
MKPLSLAAHEIAVWYIDLTMIDDITRYQKVLSAAEQERAAQFKVEQSQRDFIIMRGSLRLLLSRYLRRLPNELEILLAAQGKPYLADSAWQFNVSHTQGAGLIAVSRDLPVGVDIENSERKIDIDGIGSRIFTLAEQSYIEQAEDSQAAFFECWARKEAVIKAYGHGMFVDLQKVDTTQPIVDIMLQNLPRQGSYHLAVAVQCFAEQAKQLRVDLLRDSA